MKSIFASLILLIFFNIKSLAGSPVPGLSAYYDNRKNIVKLKWQHPDNGIITYVLQKSADNIHWSDIYKIDAINFSSNKIASFTDLQPDPNKNNYRLKCIFENNSFQFSQPIVLIMANNANSWVMYPVPVGPVLNLQYTGSEMITGAISIFIENMQGMVFYRLRSSSLNRTIQVPMSTIGKGIYNVRIMLADKVLWNQRFVK